MKPSEYKISNEKFKFVQEGKVIRDKELSTKPLSYFQDAFNRFKKNKGSITAAIIIIILVLFAIIAPIVSPYKVSYTDGYFQYTLPKSNLMYNLGIDFWDGCSNKEFTKEGFYYHYYMGEETGHYAIKNQEYEIETKLNNKNQKVDYYKIRLDSYQLNGVVFKNLSAEEYKALQEYQNNTGIQVIYPQTVLYLRPSAIQDNNNANYWYETEAKNGKTSIVLDKNNQVTNIYYKVWTLEEIEEYVAALPDKTKAEQDYKANMRDDLIDVYNFGDDYDSLRIEGEDSDTKYYYAVKNETGYSVRINYYEYYIYYHTQIVKDGIDEPLFFFGTTNSGQDIFTCLSSGARFSFLLAICIASVNLIVGAIYGAIEGYYGGKIDLVMERIVEILSSVPFMIVITLLKYHMPNTGHALLLFISFFLTGWISMAGRTRMQFYRFKNQEYVLAARTLGASDWRIMFKHIFPNALGTLITSCVLVIPGVIFSETSLSYLGIINLNSGDMTSVGTLLANGQPFLVSYPHMILFPALFICLLMLSFNLFGNGLRDAFNPSLRGAED